MFKNNLFLTISKIYKQIFLLKKLRFCVKSHKSKIHVVQLNHLCFNTFLAEGTLKSDLCAKLFYLILHNHSCQLYAFT